MRRVLQVLGSLQRGGAETFVMNVYRRIDRSKIQFDFLVKERVDNGYEEEVERMGARIFEVKSPKEVGFVNYVFQQKKVMQGSGPYIAVHSHVNYLSGMTLLAAKLAGMSCRIAHSHSTKFPQGLGERASKAAITPLATKLFACSDEAGRSLFGDAHFEVVENGVDWEKFVIASYAKRKSDSFIIAQVGRFVEVKNQEFTVDVLSELDRKAPGRQKIVFLGDGPLLDDVKEEIARRGLGEAAIFPGNVPDPEMWLGEADVVVMPSLYEGIPLSAIEAQCANCNLLVSDRVSRDIDLGLGTCCFLPLEIGVWVEKLYDLMGRKASFLDGETIRAAVQAGGFSPDAAAARLGEYYEGLGASE